MIEYELLSVTMSCSTVQFLPVSCKKVVTIISFSVVLQPAIMLSLILLLILYFTTESHALEIEKEEEVNHRHPKLFFVSSTTSTTTLTTNTVCYVQSSTVIQMLTCKKKKRSVLNEMLGNTQDEIKPAKSSQSFEEAVEKIKVDIKYEDKEDINNIVSGLELTEREGKFLNYWLTTTITATFTTFTGTSSIASILCTPAGYTRAGCPASNS